MSLTSKQSALMLEYVELDRKVKEGEARKKAIRQELDFSDLIDKFGTASTLKTKVIVLGDFQIERTVKGGGPALDTAAALELVQKKYKKLKGVVELVPTLNTEEFAKAAAGNLISKADLKSVTIMTQPTEAISVKPAKKDTLTEA